MDIPPIIRGVLARKARKSPMALLLCLLVGLPLLLPQTHARAEQAPTMWYWHNWADKSGISHMTKCPIRNFDLKTMSRPAGPQWQDRQPPGAAQMIFTVQPAHWNGTWHPDPKVQWIIPLSGSWYVTAMDGTKVVMGPGEISLGEDQRSVRDGAGRIGHYAGNVGDGPVQLLVIQTDEVPTIGQPCRFR